MQKFIRKLHSLVNPLLTFVSSELAGFQFLKFVHPSMSKCCLFAAFAVMDHFDNSKL